MLELRGQRLTLDQIVSRCQRAGASDALPPKRARACEASRAVVEKIVAENRTVYGVNTGFGKLSDVRIDPDKLSELQLNLVRSHSCGLGNPLSEAEARAMLLLRANVLACGLSGARAVVADTLVAMLEQGVTPVIPEKGSVGASGDLAPLAHLALAAIGEGEAFYQGERLAERRSTQARRNRAAATGSEGRPGATEWHAGDGRSWRAGACIALNA